jgi:hypothetical protein
MPGSGKHNVNNIDSFFKVRPSKTNLREGEQVSFLENGDLIKQEKRNGIVYETKYTELNKVKVDSSQQASTTSVVSSNITGVLAGTGLTGGGSIGTVTLNIDSTVATLTGTQTLTNKTLASPTFTGTANGANLTLTGDLTVGGTTTTLNAQNLQVKDKNIVLNYLDGDASSTADGAGITIQDAVNSTTDATILWDNSSPTNSPGEFDFSHSINVTGNISLSGTVDGRDIATDGSKLDGIEALADVTDTTNVTAAGALMDSEVSNLSFVKGLTSGISNGNVLVANAAVSDNDFLKIDGTSVEGRTVAEMRSDLNVEDGADVTDTTNVTAAGALMDSEVTDLDGIKSLTVPNSTTISAFAKTYLDDADTTTFQNTIFGTTDVALGGQAKPRVVTLDYKTDSLTAIGSGDNFIIIDASDNYNLKVANFPTIIGTTGTINANEFARFTNSTTLQALTAAETVTALGLDDVPTVSSGSNDRIATFTGTSALQGESNLTFNSSNVLYVNGSVGIGATSPSASLEISKAGGEYLDLDISGISSGTSKLRFLDGGTAKFELRHFAGSALLNANLSVYDHNTSSEALTIQAGGNVGVGTNSPKTKLDIENTTAPTLSNDTHAGEAIFLRSGGSAGDGNVQAVLAFGKADGSSRRSGSAIASVQTDSDADKVGIGFYTSSSSASSQTMGQRMLLDHTGNVGIGTTSPAVDLHILDTGGHSQLRIETDNASSGAYLELESTTNKYQIYNVGGDLGIDESGVATRFIIKDSTGNVGIGTNSPSQKLHVVGSVRADTAYYVDGNIVINTDGNFEVHDTRAVTPSTDIGLKGVRFDFKNNSADGLSDGGSYHGVMTFQQWNDTSGGHIHALGFTDNGYVHHRNASIGGTFGNWKKLIQEDNSGNVGIGTASPAYKLHLEQAGGVMQQLKATDSAQSYMKFVNSTTGDGQFSDGFLFGLDSDETIAIWNYESTAMRFATAGSERVRIDSSGNVGIGTTSPSTKLEVASGNSGGDAALDSPTIRINNTTASSDWDSGDIIGTLEWYASDTSGNAPYVTSFIKSVNEQGNGTLPSGALTFGTSAYNAVGGATEAMRIDDSGNVGIGTTSPTNFGSGFTNLQISGSTAGSVQTTDSTNSATAELFTSGGVGYVGTRSNHSFRIKSNDTTAMTIDTSQRVGIGNTSPDATFHVGDNSSSFTLGTTSGNSIDLLKLETDSTNANQLIFSSERVSDGSTWTSTRERIRRRVDSSNMGYIQFGSSFDATNAHMISFGEVGVGDYMGITGDGKVGIGTTSPSAKLEITGSNDTTNMIIGAPTHVVGGGSLSEHNSLLFDNTQVSGASGQVLLRQYANSHNDSEGALAILTTSTGGTTAEAMRIRGSGNVGIGETSPTEKLEVNGNIRIGNGGGLFVEHSGPAYGGTVIHPNGGTFRTNSSAFTGAIKITLPTGTGTIADMVSFWVDIFDYTTDESLTCYIAGYAYQTAGSNEWVNEEALMLSANQNRDFTVRFGHDGSNHCVYIGELDSGWSYPQITIRNVQIGFSSDVDTYNDGWSVGFESSAFQNVDETQTDNFPYAKGLKSSSNMGAYIDGNEKFRFATGGTFHATNDVIAFSTTPSDKKLKTNVKDIEYGLDTIMKLNPKQYDWKKDNRKDIGFIAQEVEEVIPEIVKDNEWFDDKIKTMDYEKLTAVLIKAVQEQQKQIEELKNG